MSKNMKWIIGIAVFLVVCSGIYAGQLETNNAGYRTVVQTPRGKMLVQFDAGFYNTYYGTTTPYADFLTYNFSSSDKNCEFERGDGVKVRYQDGGEGVVCGMARINLPDDKDLMVSFHKTYRSEEGSRIKLMNQEFPKVLNLTAALMTSEEAYATKRSEFIRMADDQARKGTYKTRLGTKEIAVGSVGPDGKQEMQVKEVPKIVIEGGVAVHANGAFKTLGITVSQFDMKQWDFEPKTIVQIQAKRDANMKIITAKANADSAYWEEQEVIAQGKKNVAKVEYEELQKAKRDIVQAEKDKTIAETIAAQRVSVAKQKAVEKGHELDASRLEAKALIVKKEAEAKGIKVVMEADGYKAKMIEAQVTMNKDMADAIGNQKWVPDTIVSMGGSSNSTIANGTNAMQQTLEMVATKMAIDLGKDLTAK